LNHLQYDEIRNGSCCPSIIISLAGPWLHISGAIFADVFIVQTLFGYLYLGGNPYYGSQIKYVAKAFEAVAQAVRSLRVYYRDLPVRSELKPCLPSPSFSQDEPLSGSLVFKSRIFFQDKADNRRPLFRATLNNIPVIVKFCETYGEAAHRRLAAEGLAPSIHYCSRITGGAIMVVMDEVAGRSADQEFKDNDIPLSVLKDIKHALEVLHREGFVFGDVRRPNVMVTKSLDGHGNEGWHGKLVDFDWAGKVNEATYPIMLNDSIRWARGVEGGAVILPEHDDYMINQLRKW
jgi:serine/threonine protein kinase